MALKDNILKYSKGQIDNAGTVLISSDTDNEKIIALDTLSNFRSCHAYPINTFQSTLRTKINKLGLGTDYLVSQRLKRTPSMVLKLQRFTSLRLSQMQDIGGLRAILPSIDDVKKLVDSYKNSPFQHEIKNEKDYIEHPKDSGYRCYHIVYKYKNKINPAYNGLMVELQIRTKLQHAWATAVETVGTFIDHSLKSSQGPTEWLDFFALIGNAFALIETTPALDKFKNHSNEEIFKMVKSEANRLQVIDKLEGFRDVISNIEYDKQQGSFHLVVLDISNHEIRVRTFPKTAIEQASAEYLKEEALISDTNKKQVVLVSSSSLENLRKAYPSYFLDTQEFIKTLKEIIERN